MKKVLILAYDFPPYVSVGGLRPYNWLKYLKEFGVEPIVVTRQWGNTYGNGLDYIAPSASKAVVIEKQEYGTVIRAPYFPSFSNRLLLKYGADKFRFIRKVLTAWDEIRQFLWVSAPKKQLYLAARDYLKANKVDVLLATGEPFVLFSFAKHLSKEFDIPWIADYRDPWSQNKGRQQNKLYTLWNQFLERKIVLSACSIITVSEFIKHKLHELFRDKTIHILPNGYDPEVIEKVAQLPQTTQQLTISYIGTIYNWHPWRSFLEQYAAFLENNLVGELKLHFYGINISKEVNDFIQQLPVDIQSTITIYPKMPNAELLEKIANENVMLLFNDYSIRGTKIYDYIGLNRKIILCYANDSKALILKDKHYSIGEMEGVSKQLQANLILATNSGIIVQNEGHLQTVFKDLVEEFNENGKIACNSIGAENYSRKIQVQKLATIIKEDKY